MRILLLLALAAPLAAQTTIQPFQGGTGIDTSASTGCPTITSGIWTVVTCGGGGGGGGTSTILQTNGVNNTSQTTLNFISSTVNAAGLVLTPFNSVATEKFELTGLLNSLSGGTGVANSATLTLGSANHNYATLGTGIIKNTTTTGALSNATAADVSSLFTGSSPCFINKDGTCSNPSGSGTVTTTGSPVSGNLTKFTGATSISNADLSGAVSTSGTLVTTLANNAVATANITNSAVTLAKISNAAANSKLVGSGASGIGVPYVELTLGTGLSMTGTTLSATGTAAGTAGQVQKTNGSGVFQASSIIDNGTTVTIAEPTQFTGAGIPIKTSTTSNTDLAGFVTLSTGSGTYTFTATYATAPVCVATDTTAVNAVKASASTTVLTITGTGSDVVAYICLGRT